MSVVISTELCECRGTLRSAENYVYHLLAPHKCYVDLMIRLEQPMMNGQEDCACKGTFKSDLSKDMEYHTQKGCGLKGTDTLKASFPTQEKINHPQHYGGDTVYETIKVIEAWQLDFHLGNAVKYISRAGRKEGSTYVEDLEKAHAYLTRALTIAKGEEPRWK